MDFGDSDDEDDGEGGAGEEGEPNDVNFNVTVTKGGSALVFECTSDGSYVDIRHVSLEPADGSSTGSSAGLDEDTAFSGPVFGELDDELQNGFRAFLAARGIDDALGEYLRCERGVSCVRAGARAAAATAARNSKQLHPRSHVPLPLPLPLPPGTPVFAAGA